MFINATETLGVIIKTGTETVTGSIFLTLLIIILVLMVIAMMFGIPLEFTAILVLPLLLACMSEYSDFVAVGSVFFIYLALIVTQKFIFK